MNKAFYTGRSGLLGFQSGLDIASHNLVNSGTTGYKATKAEFRELIYNNMDANKNRELPENEKIKAGSGMKVQNQDLLFKQGNLQSSDYELDFAIAGSALFAIQTPQGIAYTRDGSFDVSIEGGNAMLVTSNGEYVLDQNYQRISLPYEAQSNTLNLEGVKSQLGLFSFDNPNGLIRTDGSTFLPSTNSGEAQNANAEENELMQGVLERSNTDVAQTMADVIVLQKAYQFSARVVTAADEVEQVINSLRG